jgi:hypothetical protein
VGTRALDESGCEDSPHRRRLHRRPRRHRRRPASFA